MAESAATEHSSETEHDTSYGVDREYRIALLGRTGSGKSATGNHILGDKLFVSKLSASAVRKECKFETAERFGKKCVVVDTPELFDTKISNENITKEIVKCIGILSPGPHVFILVVKIDRFTPEEQATVKTFSEIFGDEFYRFLIVLFTRKDELENNDQTIDDYVKEVPDELRELLQRCEQKYIAFDNSRRGMKDDSDVIELIRMMEKILQKTGKSHYSNEMFEKAEQEFQRRAEEVRLKGKEEIDKKKREIKEALLTKTREVEDEKANLEALRKEVESRKFEIQAMELEVTSLSEKIEKARQKQQTADQEMESMGKKIETKEKEIKEMETKYKKELEAIETEQKQKADNMRENTRKEYEEGKHLNLFERTVVAAVKTVWDWFWGK